MGEKDKKDRLTRRHGDAEGTWKRGRGEEEPHSRHSGNHRLVLDYPESSLKSRLGDAEVFRKPQSLDTETR